MSTSTVEKPTKKPFDQSSSSQIDTFELCMRKWWLSKRMKLPRADKPYFHYGTGVHTINERWLKADDSGRDENGEPVELFPEGWEFVYDDDGVLRHIYSEEEQKRIRWQVEKAIENGTLERKPGRQIEHKFSIPVGDTGVVLIGYIDLLHVAQHEVQDHKTAKNRRYATTKGKLEKGNRQLLIYAKALLEILRAGMGADPTEITVRHNVFLKEMKEPYPVETTYSVERIEAQWEKVIEVTREMMTVSKIQSLADIEEPDEGACHAYGGCDFLSICGRRETIAKYRKRVNHINATRVKQLQAQKAGDPTMGAFDGILAAKANNDTPKTETPAAAANPPAAEKPAKPAAAPAETAAEARRMAPWADPECPACEENDVGGFSSKGKVCRICESTMEQRKVADEHRPAAFDTTEPFSWAEKKPVETAPPAAPEAEKPAAKGAVERATEAPPKPKKSAGRAKKSFTLCVGCAPIMMPNANGNFVSGDKLFAEYREKFCEEKGVESFWHYDPFARRDAMALAAENVADDLGTKIVVFTSTHNPDIRAFVEALKPFASTMFQSVIG